MGEFDGWEPVREASGDRSSALLRSPGGMAYARTAAGQAGLPRLEGERDRLLWLAGEGMPVPRVLDWLVPDGSADGPWAAALVVSGVPGIPADAVAPALRPAASDAVREAMGRLHALEVSRCPFDARPDADEVDRLPEAAARAVREAYVEDLVVTHGALHPRHVLVHPASGTLSGLLGVGGLGTADRHRDLAVVQQPGLIRVDLDGHPTTRGADPARLAAYAELSRPE